MSTARDAFQQKGIEWFLNPPTASHMGGVWERIIRTISKVFTGIIIRNTRLTDDMLITFFCEAENIINGRPMTKLSDDVRDSPPLTHNHFLRLGANTIHQKFNRGDMYRKQWRHVQHVVDVFWRKWLREYLPQLQRRKKWLRVTRCSRKDDLVLVVDEMTPRSVWPMGIVLDAKKGRDGLVRTARVKTESSVLVRPVTK